MTSLTPPEAANAGAKALREIEDSPEYVEMTTEDMALAVLEAGAREIRSAERERIAAWLQRAAAGRREYAANGPDDDARARLELAASCCESAALLITDPSRMLDVIPAWRWTDEERASLMDGAAS